jgi:hypothetical protein
MFQKLANGFDAPFACFLLRVGAVKDGSDVVEGDSNA